MNLLKTLLSTSAFAIASVALHAQLPTKVESFPGQGCAAHRQPFQTRRGYGYPLSARNRPRSSVSSLFEGGWSFP